MIHPRPKLAPEDRIDHPDIPVRWECEACQLCYVVPLSVMQDEHMPRDAFQVWDHYHIARAGHDHTARNLRLSTDASRFSTVELDGRDLLEGLAWWEGFRRGQRIAAEELRVPIDNKLRELVGWR